MGVPLRSLVLVHCLNANEQQVGLLHDQGTGFKRRGGGGVLELLHMEPRVAVMEGGSWLDSNLPRCLASY